MSLSLRSCLAATLLCLAVGFPTLASAQYVPISLLTDGDLLPSGNEADNVGQPSINASGQVATEGDDTATTLDDFIWVDGVEVLRSGDVLSVGTLDNVDIFDTARHLNAGGDVAWDGDIDGTTIDDDEVLGLNNTVIMIEGTIYATLDPVRDPGEWTQVSVDDSGAVYAEVDFDGGSTTGDELLIRIPFGGGPVPMQMNLFSEFREDALITGGPLDTEKWETSAAFAGTVVNGLGTLITDGNLDETGTTTTTTDDVLIRKLPGSDYELLLRAGDPVTPPIGAPALISSFIDPAIAGNNDWAIEVDTDGDTANDNLIMGDILGSGTIIIAQEGEDISALTGFPGTTLSFTSGVAVNSVGQVAFFASVGDDGVNVPPYTEALFRWEAGALSMLMTNQVPIPNLPGETFTDFESNDIAMNDLGQIVFQGDATTTAFDGIFEAFLPPVFGVTGLTCSAPNPDQVTAMWTNAQAYDGVRIYENGVLATTLAGTATTYTTAPVTAPQSIEIGVEPFIGADNAVITSCSEIAIVPPDFTECATSGATISFTSPVADVLTVVSNVLIDDVTISVDITHPNQTDLDMTITSPTGTQVTLTTDQGGSNDDVLTTFADFGNPASANLNDFSFTQPEGPGTLADFGCQLSGGDWVLDIVDDATANDGVLNQWCVNLYESVGDPDCCPKPTDLTCANVGACGGPGAELTWSVNGSYDLLQLVRDDGVNPLVTIPLAVGQSSFSDVTVVAGTTYSYTLQYTCAGGALIQDSETCSTPIDVTTVPPVTDLVVDADFCANTVTTSWNTNGVNYSSLGLFRAGVFVADVTGLTTFVDTTPSSGSYSIVADCGGSTAVTSGVADLTFGSVSDLTCVPDGLGGVALSWINNDSYTTLELTRNGVLVSPQPALGDTSYVDATPDSGCNTYALTAGCAAFSESQSCSLAFFDPGMPITDTLLMIPESTNDMVGLYSKDCGAYVGDLIDLNALPAGTTLGLAINAVLGPDDQIYVSDQSGDQILRFDRDGNFVDVFASNATASIDNVRGLEFRGTDLLVVYDGTTGNEGISVIDSAGVSQGLLITAPQLWDVVVLPDDRLMVADDGNNTVQIYMADGTSPIDLLIPGLSFPEQLTAAPSGTYLLTEFTNDLLVEFDLAGTIIGSYPIGDAGTPRGNYELDNGNILITGSNGVFSLDRVSGNLSPIRTGINARFVEALPPAGGGGDEFYRGDTNNDGGVNIADAIYLLGNLFPGANPPNVLACLDAADSNDDGGINIADAISLLGSLFGAPAVPLPLPNVAGGCDVDPTPGDALDCATFGACP